MDILSSQITYQSEIKIPLVNECHIKNERLTHLYERDIKVQVFISHWFSTWDNIHCVERSCLDFGYDTTVLNTTIQDKEGWENSIPISFFRQFEFACRTFDSNNEYMLFITADVKTDKWIDFFRYADKVLKLKGIGTFSPTLTAATTDQFWPVPFLYFDPESSAKIPFRNDIIVTYIQKQLVEKFLLFLDYFNRHPDTFNPVIGWGPDQIIRVLTYHLDLIGVRDRAYTFMHPWTNSYDTTLAQSEMMKIRDIADQFFKENSLEPMDVIDQRIMDSSNKESFKILIQDINQLK